MLWILLPAYNEEESLRRLLPKVNAFAAQQKVACRLVVVNDGSSDATAQVLQAYNGAVPLDVVTHSINRGLGETERDGFEYIARNCQASDVIVRFDADDTHDPAYILRMTEKLNEGFDVVNTSRFQPGGDQKGVNAYRSLLSYAANLFMKCMFNIKGVRDYSCGFRAYRAQVIMDAVELFGNRFLQLKGLGFTCTLETIVKLNLLGCRFAEVPFVLRYDQKASPSKMVSSVTMYGYFMMAFMYNWPVGGWRYHYRRLRDQYRQDREEAVHSFKPKVRAKTLLAQIG